MSPQARAEFIRGPYDGLIIDVEQVDRFVRDDAVQESYDNRLFLLMPPPLDWERVVEGKAHRDGPFVQSYPYELSVRPGGLKFVYCGISQYREAMEGQDTP
jgi:hypothetical protein